MSEELDLNEEIRLNMVDVTKISLDLGDVLMVSIKSDSVGPDDLRMLSKGFQRFFPDNQVLVMAVEKNGDIRYSVATTPKPAEVAPTANFCNDCGCGKKEAWEQYNIVNKTE
jgi:hypothetical protein